VVTVRTKPYDFNLNPEHTAFVVIDMQRDFIEPGAFERHRRLCNAFAELERAL
jgi:nicotinamidase-related amidase